MPPRHPGRAGRPLQGESTVAGNAGEPRAERRSVRYGDSGAPKQDIRPQLARNFLSRRIWSSNRVCSPGGRILASCASEFPAPKRLRSAGMGELITALNAFASAKINHRGRTACAGAILEIVVRTASGPTDQDHSRRRTNRRLLAEHRPFERDRRLIDYWRLINDGGLINHRHLINDWRLIDYRCRGGIRATAEHDHALSLRRGQAEASHSQ